MIDDLDNPDDILPNPFGSNVFGDDPSGDLLKEGERFGSFIVERCISKGLIANYYLMRHVRDLHDLTVGVLHERTLNDPKCLKRLQDLQRTLSHCDHEGVPKIKDCLEINGHHCICLEAVEGVTLTRFFEQHRSDKTGALEVDVSGQMIALLHGLLGHIHAQGLDHRDLNTDLIFVQNDGSIKLLGVGVKAALGSAVFESIVSASVAPISDDEQVNGLSSFDVLSPECSSGQAEDSRVDIYMAGVVGYWMLSGQKPPKENFVIESPKIKELGEDWLKFFEKSLARNRDERFQSCKTALSSLKHAAPEETSEQATLIQKQIDNMPVPRSIVDRGSMATKAYKFLLIALLAICIIGGLGTLFLGGDDAVAEEDQLQTIVAKRPAAGESANLLIKVLSGEASCDLKDHKSKFMTKDGELALVMTPGTYQFDLTAEYYYPKTIEVTVVDGTQQTYEVSLDPKLADISVTAADPGVSVVAINAEGEETTVGVSDGEGTLEAEEALKAGTYTIAFRKPGYEAYIVEGFRVELDGANFVESAPLVAKPSSIEIKTEPSGARIFVNNEELGLSPVTLEDAIHGEPYVVKAFLKGYRPAGRQMEVKPGQQAVLDFGPLDLRVGQVAFDMTFLNLAPDTTEAELQKIMDDLTIELDGVAYPYDSDVFTRVTEGEHLLKFIHPLYFSDPIRFRIKDYEEKRIAHEMTPKESSIEIAMAPDLVPEVLVNKVPVDVINNRFVVPADQLLEVELRVQDHYSMTKQFKVAPTANVVWQVDPIPIPGPELKENWLMPYVFLNLTWIEPGSVTLGSPLPESGRIPNEGPATQVNLTKGFWVGTYEVTQNQYKSVMGNNPSDFKGPMNPVENITWDEAKLFCQKLTEAEAAAGRLPEGYVYRLPTEGEWEYVARAGTETPFFWGSVADASYGNFRGVYPVGSDNDKRVPDHYGTNKVGSYNPNAFGVYDMHGNVAEWTEDGFNARHRGKSLTDPKPHREEVRDLGGSWENYAIGIAVRGGSWEDYAVRVRSAAREEIRADNKGNSIGFRVFLAPEF